MGWSACFAREALFTQRPRRRVFSDVRTPKLLRSAQMLLYLRSSAMHLGVQLAPRRFRYGGLAGARVYASGRSGVRAHSIGGMEPRSVPRAHVLPRGVGRRAGLGREQRPTRA